MKELITKDYFLKHDKKGITQVNALPVEDIDFLSFYRLMEDKGEYTAGVYFWNNGVWEKLGSKVENLYITDINRLSNYLYKVDFDKLPPYKELDLATIGGCTSFIRDGKMYRSYDFNYDETCEFLVRTNDFTGMAYIPNLTGGHLDMEKINQLPYHLVDGVNKHGIMVSVHYIYNDFSHTSYTGNDKLPATKAIYYILSNLNSMADINTLTDLQKIEIPQSIADEGYCVQFMISDGTTTYTITPASGTTMNFTDISAYNGGVPKMTNFVLYKDGAVALTDSELQTRPTGIERYNMITANTTLEALRFTKCYETTDRLSEFIGMGGTTKSSTTAELEAQYNIAKAEYDNRQRNGETWQSVHSIVYSNTGVVSSLCVQEDYTKDYFAELKFDNQNIVSVDTLPTENIDENILYYLTTDETLYHYKNGEWHECGGVKVDTENSTIIFNNSGSAQDILDVNIVDTNGNPILEKQVDLKDKVVFERKEQTLINKFIDAENNDLITIIDVSILPTNEDEIKRCIYHLTTDDKHYIYNFDNSEWKELGGKSGEGIRHGTIFPSDAKDQELFALTEDIDEDNTKGLYIYHSGQADPQGTLSGVYTANDDDKLFSAMYAFHAPSTNWYKEYNINYTIGGNSYNKITLYYFETSNSTTWQILLGSMTSSTPLVSCVYYSINKSINWHTDARSFDFGGSQDIDTILYNLFQNGFSKEGTGEPGFKQLANMGGGSDSKIKVYDATYTEKDTIKLPNIQTQDFINIFNDVSDGYVVYIKCLMTRAATSSRQRILGNSSTPQAYSYFLVETAEEVEKTSLNTIESLLISKDGVKIRYKLDFERDTVEIEVLSGGDVDEYIKTAVVDTATPRKMTLIDNNDNEIAYDASLTYYSVGNRTISGVYYPDITPTVFESLKNDYDNKRVMSLINWSGTWITPTEISSDTVEMVVRDDLLKYRFTSSGYTISIVPVKNYVNVCRIVRSGTSENTYAGFSIITKKPLEDTSQVIAWLSDHGYTSITSSHPASGIISATNYYVSTTSGGANTKQIQIPTAINGVYTEGGELYFNYGTSTTFAVTDRLRISSYIVE